MKHTVYIDDNFHYMDDSSSYTLGVFNSWSDAVNAAKAVIDEFLLDKWQDCGNTKKLMEAYCMFGEEPSIDKQNLFKRFSARKYAKKKCKELFKK